MLFKVDERIFEMTIDKFVEDVCGNNYSIPAFQRKYLWGKTSDKVVDLLNSINNGFNIGTIVFWDSNILNIKRTLQNIPSKTSDGILSYIVDGQQRTLTLISLFSENNIAEIDKGKIFFEWTEMGLVFTRKKPDKNPWITFETFAKYLKFSKNNNKEFPMEIENYKTNKQKQNSINDIKKFHNIIKSKNLVIGYKLIIDKDDLSMAVEQFSKINQSGIKLNQFDILDALAYGDKGTNYKISELASQLSDLKGWADGRSKKMFSQNGKKIILNSFKLIKNHENDEKNLLSAKAISNYKNDDYKIIESIFQYAKKASATLKDIGFDSIINVPYTHNITSLIFLMYLFKKNEMDLEKIAKHIIISTGLQRRYDKSASSHLTEDLKLLISQIEKRENVNLWAEGIEISHSQILQTSYVKSGAFEKSLIFLYLENSKPLDYKTQNKIKMDSIYASAKTKDHIFPQSKYKEEKGVHSMANISLIKSDTNNEKDAELPKVYFSSLKWYEYKNMYTSQQIDKECYNELLAENFKEFIKIRSLLMSQNINKYIKDDLNNEG